MTTYKITWEIEVEATGPEDAAREAQRIQRDPSSIANVFGVVDPSLDPEGVWVIDLDHLPPTTSSGLLFCPECKGKRYIADGQGNWARCEACYLLSPPPPLPPAVTPATAISVLAAIHRVLDGQEWSGDTLEIIAQLMRDAGYEIHEPATTGSDEPDTSDIPEAGEDWFKRARLKLPVVELPLATLPPEDMRGYATVPPADDPLMVEIDRLSAIQKEHGFSSVWSMLDGLDFSQPHPWPGAKRVVYVNHSGDSGAVVDAIGGPTWLDLWRAADMVILRSGDDHHIYIEHFELRGDELFLTTGS